jgi:hypothetical protein
VWCDGVNPHQGITSAPARPPLALEGGRMPCITHSCHPLRTPAFPRHVHQRYWTHLDSLITCYHLPYICHFSSSVPRFCINCLMFDSPYLLRLSSVNSCDRIQKPTHKASGSTGVPVGMVALGLHRWNWGCLASSSGPPHPSWLERFPCPGWRPSHVGPQPIVSSCSTRRSSSFFCLHFVCG